MFNSDLKYIERVLNGLLTDPEILTRRVPISDSTSAAAYYQKVNPNEHVIEVPLVGIEKENISVEIESKLLTVSAKTNSQSKFARDFKHSWTLHENAQIEEMTADFKNGLLKIVIPNKKKETQKKVIAVSG